MEPKIKNNDLLIVDMVFGRDFVKVPGIYVVRVGDVVYIKRCEFLGNGDVKLISLNPKYPIYQPMKDDGLEYEILGIVCGRIHSEIYNNGLLLTDQGIE